MFTRFVRMLLRRVGNSTGHCRDGEPEPRNGHCY